MKKKTAWLGIGVFILIISSILAFWNPLEVIQFKLTDLMFRNRAVSNDITIIAIDEKSLSPEANLGRFKDWPRSYFSQLLGVINEHKPAVIGFDLDFKEGSRGISDLRVQQLVRDYEIRFSEGVTKYPWYSLLKQFEYSQNAQPTHPDDVDFAKALGQSGSTVLASQLIFTDPLKVSGPIFKGTNITTGFINAMPDRDGVVRRFTPFVNIGNGVENSFAYAIAKVYLKAPSEISDSQLPDFESQVTPIAYSAEPNSYRMLSFADVLSKNFDPSAIGNKIILIGPAARILQDLHNSPTSANPMTGVEIHANIIQQILEKRVSTEQGKFSLFIALAIFTLLGSFLFFKFRLAALAWIFSAVLIAYPLAAYVLHQRDFAINIVYPELAWIITALAVLWYRNQTEFREKKRITAAFAHYVSPIVVNELAKNPDSLKLGGTRQTISVLFSDIVGFTTLAEKLSPEDTVALLNDYLTAMTEVVFSHNGTLDKYQGDAIMALFGAPLHDEHFASNACHAALGMRKALVELHEKWNAIPALPFRDELMHLDFRVGIATGQAIVGNVGSEKRFDYTAIGDIVNTGSRLESVNRKYGTHIIVDKETFTEVTENHNQFVFRKLDAVKLKGKQQETELFELFALAENVTSDMKAMLDDFENGRLLYIERNFIEAKQYFEAGLAKVPSDGPSQIYSNRCAFYLRKPPGRDWSPVVELESK